MPRLLGRGATPSLFLTVRAKSPDPSARMNAKGHTDSRSGRPVVCGVAWREGAAAAGRGDGAAGSDEGLLLAA